MRKLNLSSPKKCLKLLLVSFFFSLSMGYAQCYEPFYTYQYSPPGQLCSPGYITLRTEYFTDPYNYVSGEFRWYDSETSTTPLQTNYIYSDFQLTADYSFYASNGSTVWVSFFNYNTYCESYRMPYTVYISSAPNLFQDYAQKCREDVAKVQLSSNVSGVTFQLYKLYEYYDPWYGYVQDYQLVQSNYTGYFEIYDFYPGDEYSYYAKVYQPYGCGVNYYYQLWFETVPSTPPTITGNLSVTVGTGTTLIVNGGTAYTYNWYDANDNLITQGWVYSVPANLPPGSYTYKVKASSADGSCLSDPAIVTVVVSLPPITYTPLFTNGSFTKTIDLSRPVGTIAGSTNTTPSGAVTYSMPVYTPPGTNGFQPTVGITYNSQGGDGPMGWGWNITGLSSIGRTGRNIYHNGIVKPVTYTTDDAFSLDGMRLNVITGSNGANGTVYAGEAESFAKIVSHTTGQASNPDWFEVTSKDGSVMEFGRTADSRILTDNGASVVLWRLNRILDVNGNYIDFVYENNARDTRIKAINYTGNINTGQATYNSIVFDYKVRTDRNTSYDAGASLSNQHLLEKITVNGEGSTVIKTYQFDYGFDNITSLLKEVTEFGVGNVALNSTIFLYGATPQNMLISTTIALTGEYDFFAGDFDADGHSDLLAAKSYFDANANTRLHNEYSLVSDVSESSYTLMYMKSLPQNVQSEIIKDKKFFSFMNGDYNGDGRDDVMEINASVENFSCGVGYIRKISNVTINYTKSFNNQTGWTEYQQQTFTYPTYFGEPYQYVNKTTGNYFIPGDFDGDGNQDYIMVLARKRQNGTCLFQPRYVFDFKAFLTSPSSGEVNLEIANFGFGANPSPDFYAGTVAGADTISTIDFDGDGKMELLVTKDYTTYVLAIQRVSATTGFSFAASVIYSTSSIIKDNKIFPGDFNGDRKTDLLVRNNSGGWNIFYSTGTAYTSQSFAFNQAVVFNGSYGDHIIQVADFNGDGKSDILQGFTVSGASPNQSKFSLYYSRGSVTGFYHEQYTYYNLLALGIYGSSQGIVSGDFNGDGRADIINRPNIYSPADFISFKPFGKERMLAKITDGHNTTLSFEYKLLTDKTNYPWFYDRTVSLDDPANHNPYNYVQLPLYATSSISSPDGIGGVQTNTFNYENAVVHRAAKGFLGFRKITTKNDVTGITSITENNINTQFAVPYTVKQTTRLTATSALLSETQFTTSFTNLSTGYGDTRYLQKSDKALEIDYINGKAVETVNTYDSYGNITTSTVKTGVLAGSTVTPTETMTTTTAYGTYNTPVPARPTTITVANTRTGMSALSTTSTFTYNAKGLVETEVFYSGLPKALTHTYTYNNFGNVLTDATGAVGLNSRTITSTYDAKGRFALTQQTSGGGITQTISSTYDSKWGKALTKTSIDCLTTTFEYDAFGRLKKTTLPQRFSVNNSLVWDVAGNNVYYAFTDHPGGSPDTKTWYDKLNRETQTQTAGFNGQWLTRTVTYNAKGQVAAQTADRYASETALTTTNTYDAYGRPTMMANTQATVTNTYTTLSNGRLQTVTSNGSSQSSTKITDAAGRVITAIDNGGQLDFTYDSKGNQVEVKHDGVTMVSTAFDAYGRQSSLTDKNAGTINYIYDAYGQLIEQTDAKNNTRTMVYDGLGRLLSRTGPEGVTTYEYYTNGACSNNTLTRVIGFNGITKEYTYDTYMRPATEKITTDGIFYTTSFTHDQYSHLTKTVYPSGIEENRTYDANGGLLTVTGGAAGAQITLFTATAVNGFGQYTGFTMGNGKTSQHTYVYGTPQRYYTPGVQDLNLTFDYEKGNLLSRNDAIKNITESFTFDNLNRLTSSTVNGVQQIAVTYDGTPSSSRGNISSKTDAGNYVYKTDKVHAVAYITNPAGAQTPPANISTVEQLITYTPFLKTATITEAPYSLEFVYGPAYERVRSILRNNGLVEETRLYMGSYEKQIMSGGPTREIHYIGAGNGICAIIVKEGATVTPYYVYTDHLGSILTVTNSAGTVVEEQNFDAWGRKRNPTNWSYASVPAVSNWLYRGYTGHEHLPQFALINMNGRIYDPIQGRMLGPDNYISDLFSSQAYNRYAYALNNPLSHIDPNGDNPLVIAIIAGALIGGFMKGIQYAEAGKNFWGGFWRGALVGGASGALAFVGGGTFIANVAWGAGQGVLMNGFSNLLDGDPFFQGAGTAAIIGGAFAAVTSGIESYKNWKDGYGFGTNDGRVKQFVKAYKAAVPGSAAQDAIADRAVDFVQLRYGMTGVNMTYNQAQPDYGETDEITGNIEIGPPAFTSSSYLKYTVVHEYGHSVYERILDAHGNFVRWRYGPDNFRSFSNSTLDTDGPLAYSMEFLNAGRLRAGILPLQRDNPLWTNYTLFKDMSNNNFLNFKWLYLIPRRFSHTVISRPW
ncbi:MAG: VCBS repeat-containing protein [Niastella sp.]|nr:VCBS repeat-containing protein [Niastella sp.]